MSERQSGWEGEGCGMGRVVEDVELGLLRLWSGGFKTVWDWDLREIMGGMREGEEGMVWWLEGGNGKGSVGDENL